MQKVKRRIFSGVVCEQEVFNISARIKEIKHAAPRMRFRDEGERAKHREGISRRKHARLINENFSAASLYCTLTLDDAHEVHTFSEAKKIRDRYIRRLKYDYPDAVIFAYLGRGKSTHRIHMHMLVDGVPAGSHSKKMGTRQCPKSGSAAGTQLLQRDRPRAGLHGACQLSLRPLDARTGRTSMEANQKCTTSRHRKRQAGTARIQRKPSSGCAEGLYPCGNTRQCIRLLIL